MYFKSGYYLNCYLHQCDLGKRFCKAVFGGTSGNR